MDVESPAALCSSQTHREVNRIMNSDYERIRRALEYLDAHALEQPGLDDLADHLGLSPSHLQRLFRRWAGISPKRFLQQLTLERAKEALDGSASLLDASLDAGLSSPGRLHDLFVHLEAVTPGEYKAGGQGLTLRTGIHPSPFGHAFLAVTDRGLCALSFDDDPECRQGHSDLRDAWPRATIVDEPSVTQPYFERIFLDADDPDAPDRPRIDLHVRGTNFQIQVWRALLSIPPGRLCSYGDIARAIGRPSAARAVGGAVGRNPVAWLIPCHRVITQLGALGHYRWGAPRKRAMVALELARAEQGAAELEPATSLH